MLRKASKNKLKVSLQRFAHTVYDWYIWCGSYSCLHFGFYYIVLYWVTHSNMFWAFVSLSLSVGPPYCLHMRVKFYSSEPNNLHEELTRWIKQHTLGFFFSGSVFTDRCDILSLVVSWFVTFNFHTLLFCFFCQIPICATAEARRPQWEVGIFCFVIAVCLIHRTFLIKYYAQKYCLHWGKKLFFQGPN